MVDVHGRVRATMHGNAYLTPDAWRRDPGHAPTCRYVWVPHTAGHYVELGDLVAESVV